MAWVTNGWGGQELQIIPHKTDMGCFKVVKIRKPLHCSVCNKKLPTGSYVYGSDWIRLCLSCGEKFSNQGINKFKEIIKYIKDNQKLLEKNREKWESENALALL